MLYFNLRDIKRFEVVLFGRVLKKGSEHMPSMMNIHLLRWPSENPDVMLVFHKHSAPVQFILEERRHVICDLCMSSRSLLQSAAVGDISDCALNLSLLSYI